MSTVSDLITDIAACVCVALTPPGKDEPDLCFCGPISGEATVADIGFECDDKCGMAWVRVINAYPATVIGEIDQSGTPCGTYLGLDIEVGVFRCIEVPAADEIPTPESLMADAAQAADDMVALRRALACCESLEDLDWMLAGWTPIGPEGLLNGGAWVLSVNI